MKRKHPDRVITPSFRLSVSAWIVLMVQPLVALCPPSQLKPNWKLSTTDCSSLKNIDYSTRLYALVNPLSSSDATSDRDSDTKVISISSKSSPHESNSTMTISSDRKKKKNGNRKNKSRNSSRNKIKSMFREAKDLERKGQWMKAYRLFLEILDQDPQDAHSHLALARLQARRERKDLAVHRVARIQEQQRRQQQQHSSAPTTLAEEAFMRGTEQCPGSVHLWQAWAIYEESNGNLDKARELFEKALELDEYNPYVCHAYGLMEKKQGNVDSAEALWSRALEKKSTAALVCSLGELLTARSHREGALELYDKHMTRIQSKRERTEVYLAAAWLQERYFKKFDKAEELLKLALEESPGSSLVQVALARLEGRRPIGQKQNSGKRAKEAALRRLADACTETEKGNRQEDGRVFNAWANLEIRDKNFASARTILQKGMKKHPDDHSLLQAAGKVEERVGNYTGARALYSASLSLQPSGPALVAYALLELRHPDSKSANYTYVKQLFEEAILLDPRHGPAYNAYGRAEVRHGSPTEARSIFERGMSARCGDVASIYHGYAMLELSLGNVDAARELLVNGWKEAKLQDYGTDSPHRERALFLSHSLGTLELNSNRPSDALEVFEEGIQRYGNNSQLLLGAALCEIKLGKENSARNLLETSVLMDSKHAQAWQAWGVVEMRAGNFSTARKLFECGIRNAPRHGALWQAYATMEGRLGNITVARRLFAAGIKKAPKHVSLYQGWASMELREDNMIAAKRLITEALTLNKRNGLGWLIAAEIEKQLGNAGMAGLILRRGIECSPTNPQLYRALGEFLIDRGRINDAREILQKGVELNPMYAPLYHSLAELEARVFNLEGLAALNRKAGQLFNNNALKPLPSSSSAWGVKLRAKRSNDIPDGVAALAEKIVEQDDDAIALLEEIDPVSALDSMTDVDDELVSELLNVDSNITEV